MFRILLLNTGSNLLVTIIKLVITFVMTPLFVRNLGKYDYGLWEVLGGIIGYMGLLDIGIKPAIGRYASKYKAEQDQEKLLVTYTSAMGFMAIVGLLLLVFFLCWGVFFPHLVAENAAADQRYTLLLIILGVQLAITFPSYVAESYLEGFQKYYLKNNVTIFNSILGSSVLYFFITPQNGLVLLALVNAIGFSSKSLFFVYLLSRPAYGEIKFMKSKFSKVQLREIISFGLKSFVQGIATRIENATDSIVIGAFLGPASVPAYSIPANLVNNLRMVGWTITHAFMPLFSQLSALKEQEKIQHIYLTASRYVIALIFPAAIGICLIGGPFIGIWIGKDFSRQADIIVALLVMFTCLPFIDPFNSRYLTAIGQHGIFAKLGPISAISNLLISMLLVHRLGIVGVAIGSVVPVFFFFPFYLKRSCENLNISVFRYLASSVFPNIFPTLIMSLVVFFYRYEFGLDTYSKIFIAVGLGALVYGPLFFMLTLKTEERAFVLNRISPRRA